jgi:NTP pyrophosphatase (non-canonical NTP hydrolase)
MKHITDYQEECLNILQEECAEVIQSASKIKRFGITGRRDGDDLNNLQNLQLEIGDVLALIEKVLEANIGLTAAGLETAKQAKLDKLGIWMHTKKDI